MNRLLYHHQATYDLGFHLEMLLDEHRLNVYREAIRECVSPGDVVVDMGTGTGILALMAAQAGASRVYTVEIDESIARSTCERFASSPFVQRLVDPIVGDAAQIDLPESVDVILGEMLHSWLVEEQQAPAVKNLKWFLKGDGRILPAQVHNFAALAQVNVLQPGCPVLSPFHLWPHEPVIPTLLTKSVLTHIVNFKELDSLQIDGEIRLPIRQAGHANVLALKSRAWFTDTLWLVKCPTVFPTIYLPLSEPMMLRPKSVVRIEFHFQLGCRWTDIEVHAEKEKGR
jgi:SAM-dependent methyltransferase